MKKENILKFYQSYRSYIFPAIVVLSNLFLIVFVIYPQTAKLISNQKDMGEIIHKSQFLETKVSAMEIYNSDDLSRKLEIAMSAYPGNKDFGVAMGLLQQLVAQSGFKIVAIAQGNNSKASGGADSYELKLEIIGIKPNLPILLNNLENAPRLIRVNSIDVASGNNLQALNVSLVVEILFTALPQSFSFADALPPVLSQQDEDLITRLAGAGGAAVESGSDSGSIPTTRGKSNPFE